MSPSKEDLWRACAGRTVRLSEPNSDVYYSPQGHAENANCSAGKAVELGLPPLVHCSVLAAELEVDVDTDEFYERILLLPLPRGSDEVLIESMNQPVPLIPGSGEEAEVEDGEEASSEETASYAKVMTQSDANNGGGFSVPRHCADTIFPALNYAADPPVQGLVAYDVHGKVWNFRHIYRGTPRRHLLTSGWSTFVNRKGLVAGDSVLFHRNSKGDIGVGIRRAPRRSTSARVEEFAKAVEAAASGAAFEVRFYPRNGATEFCVKASTLKAARVAIEGQCWPGMKVKMDVENEVASGVKSCSGTVLSVQAIDPVRWPNSPWRMLKVKWDSESNRLRNPQCVSPWMIEPVEDGATFPSFPFPPFSPTPRKKRRLSQLTQLCPLFSIHQRVFPNDTPASIQGARHTTNVVQLTDKSTVSDGLGTGDHPPSSEKSEKKTSFFSLRGESIVVEKRGSPDSNNNAIDMSTEMEKSLGSGTIIQQPESARAGAPCKMYTFLFDEPSTEKSTITSRDHYNNGSGALKQTRTEPLSNLVKSAKRLTVTALPNTLEVSPGPVLSFTTKNPVFRSQNLDTYRTVAEGQRSERTQDSLEGHP